MKFTVRYIPLDRIRPAAGEERASRMLRLRRLWWDCAHLLAVRPDGRSGRYVLLRGHTRYDYLTRRTNRKVAACLVDDGGAEPPRRLSLLPGRRLLEAVRPLLDGDKPRDRRRIEGVGCQPVQRVGRYRDHTTRTDGRRGFLDDSAIGTCRIDNPPQHAKMSRCPVGRNRQR